MKTYYKVLKDGRSCHGGNLEWDLPTQVDGEWKPGKWHKVEDELQLCAHGLHLTTDFARWLVVGCTIYLAQPRGIAKDRDDDKIVCKSARLLSVVEKPEWWIEIEKFVADLKRIKWFANHGKVSRKWRVFETRAAGSAAARAAARASARAAARASAWAAARAAVGDAARAAAWDAVGDAVGDAARAAAWDAVWPAARDAVLAAARYAARYAAWDVAWDVETYATAVVAEWAIAKKHIKYIKARMEVWRRGYGVICDVDGVLYVYRQPYVKGSKS